MQSDSGFSLIEVMFAAAVIGSGLLVLIAVAADNSRQIKSARRETKALNLARRQLEAARATSFAQITEASNVELEDYTYSVMVNKIAADLKQITVRVNSGDTLEAKLMTVVKKEGESD